MSFNLEKKESYLNTEEYEILKNQLKLTDNTIKDIFAKYSKKIILNNAEYTLNKLKEGSIKTTTGQFLHSALKNNYANCCI